MKAIYEVLKREADEKIAGIAYGSMLVLYEMSRRQGESNQFEKSLR